MTIRDYEKRIEKFQFDELIDKESPADIAKAVFQKIKKSPIHSEFYVKVVLSTIRKAYCLQNLEESDVRAFYD